MKKSLLGAALFGSLFGSTYLPGLIRAQTFELGGQSSKPDQQNSKPTKKAGKQPSPGAAPSAGGMGWGSSIEVGRNARAAEDSLKRGNYAAATNFAERMTQSAPNEPRNWFLLGYSARLAGKYQASVDAYNRGLEKQPKSVEGLSGLAQTYMHMGKADEAKRLLLEVIAANPRRPTDLAMAGELFMKSGDLARAQNLLERSEAIQPSAHAEVLLAINYMKLKQPDRAKQLLDRAMKRGSGNTDVFRAVAQYHREAHEYDSAIAILQRVPNKTAEVVSELAYTYELAGKKKEAADTYEKAAGMAPQSLTTQLAAAQAELRVGELDKTRTYLARAEQLDANHYRLHATRGDLAMVEHRDTDAVGEYVAALAAMPAEPAEGILYPTQLRLDLIDAYRNLDDQPAIQQQLAKAQQDLATIHMEGFERVEYLRLRAAIRSLGDDFEGAESDLKEALALDPKNDKVELQYASLLWKTDRKDEAAKVYVALLDRDPKSRYALEAMGYLSRDVGDNKTAEMYFTRMAEAYPNDYVPYVALGDLYTSLRDFPKAQENYETAYKLAPSNTQIVVGGSNAAIDAHQVDLAGEWVERATGAMKNDPRIMRETERFLFLKGRYAESARFGEQAMQRLPHDRDAAVYLGYDYYNLGRYDDVLALVSRYETVLPKEANFPLLAGHVHRQNELLQQAIDDFSRAIAKDPRMVEALVNRGYVRNDMQDAVAAIRDFEPAIKMSPDDGIAHMGLAYSYLQLHRSRDALEETERSEKLLGETGATHMARATAYRQMRVLSKAETEYRLALKFTPDDLKIYEALADALYHAHRYPQAITELHNALQLSPDDPLIYANLAAAHAQLHQRAETMQSIAAAEREAPDQSAILLATGDALMTLGEESAAMERFTRALDAPDANRVNVRLEFAKLFVRQGKFDSAKQQVGLAFAESRVGEASPLTTDNLVEAANVFVSTHDFDLAERYYSKAKDMGASDDTVAIGLADTYIAQGKEQEAAEVLSALGNPPDYQLNYDYEIAWGNVYNQRHDPAHAVTAFAHASEVAAADDTAERAMLQAAGEEGTQVLPSVSMLNGAATAPIFVDATIYELDNKLIGAATAPPPYASQFTGIGTIFRYRHPGWPPINAFFAEQNYNGSFSLPNEPAIINRNTFDTIFNFGTTPVVRLGDTHILLNPGIQFNIQRDTQSPVQLNENLFRTYLYVNTSPLFHWLSVKATGIYEAGPFTEQNLHSRDLVGDLEFEVGRPWGHTSFITGYHVRDLLFRPAIREFFTTSTFGGLQRTFHDTWTLTVLATYVRSWRVQDNQFAIAQILVPGVRFEYQIRKRWTLDANFYYTHGEGFNIYNNVQSGFLVSYMKPLRRRYNDGSGEISVDYPLRFSFGLQQQSFYNFPGSTGTYNLRPVLSVSFF
ncbi:MAG TPA: tetratricopeptide repeat protein [Candidatus Angelobacter sp.]|nr:tetratricopeptide repeat protein [Candidatus Angelobacter sp.]